ncbi:MAG TPA: ABC transporter substrate-binding protein, partial [Burkholderiales bacterium]
ARRNSVLQWIPRAMTNARVLFCASLILALFGPLMAQAQPAKTWRLGMLTVNPRPALAKSAIYIAFLQELRSLGYREGENLVIEWRHTDGHLDRPRQEAAALMAWKPDVVFTVSGTNAIALRNASASVPIVVGMGGDLVGMRLAATLARPGGNVTGQQLLSPDLAVKRLELLTEVLPKLQRVAMLHAETQVDHGFYDRIFADLQAAAPAVGVTMLRFTAKNGAEVESAFREMAASKVDAVLVIASPFITANRRRILALAAERRIPTMHEVADEADAGGLVAYGPKAEAMFRRGAHYVDRVLKGARPAEMPIEQPTQFELVINRRSANALGVKIPASILVRADRVIE